MAMRVFRCKSSKMLWTLLAATLLSLVQPDGAAAEQLSCSLKLNFESVGTQTLSLSEGDRVSLFEAKIPKVYLSQKKADVFEIEIFSADPELRIYSEGRLRQSGDDLAQTMWDRDRIVEVRCTKN